MQLRITLVVFRVADPGSLARFYEQIGLPVAREQHGSGPVHWSVDLGTGIIELYPSATGMVAGHQVIELSATENDLSDLIQRWSVEPSAQVRQQAQGTTLIDPAGNRLLLRVDH